MVAPAAARPLALSSQLTRKMTVRPQEGEGRTGCGQRLPCGVGARGTTDWELERAGTISSSWQSWRFRGTIFPAGVSSLYELGGDTQNSSFWGRADPPRPLFATGPWAASWQPGRSCLGISGGDKWHQRTRVGLPGTSAALAKALASDSLEKVLDLSSEPLSPW